MSIKVYLYGQPAQVHVLGQMLKDAEDITVAGVSDNENKLLDELRRSGADLLLTYLDGSAATYRVTQQVYMLCPRCINFALIPESIREKEAAKILQSGIHYLYDDSINEADLASYIKNAYAVENTRRIAMEGGKSDLTKSRVQTFYSPKGGIGTTTFLLSYAVELAKKKQKVMLLDFDLQFGDIGLMTNIDTKETMAEMLQERSTPTIDTIRQYISYHKSGVNILCAPKNVEYADKIQGSQLERIITALRPYYDYILIDTSHNFNEITYTCCEQSTNVFISVRPEISSITHAKQIVSLLDNLNQKEKVQAIYFEMEKNGEIDAAKTGGVLGVPIWQTVPFDQKTAVDSLNQGEPAVNLFPRSALAKAIAKAAKGSFKPEGEPRKRAR